MTYNTRTFKENMKQAFQKAKAGEQVLITRHDETFVLVERNRYLDSLPADTDVTIPAIDPQFRLVLDGGNSSKASVGVKPETTSEVTNACHQSLRKDGDHSWYPNRDDPIIICLWCKQTRDALTGKTI